MKIIPILGRGNFQLVPEAREGSCEGCAFDEDGIACLNAPTCSDHIYKPVLVRNEPKDYKPTHGGYPNV